jgi:hypothetical protein
MVVGDNNMLERKELRDVSSCTLRFVFRDIFLEKLLYVIRERSILVSRSEKLS